MDSESDEHAHLKHSKFYKAKRELNKLHLESQQKKLTGGTVEPLHGVESSISSNTNPPLQHASTLSIVVDNYSSRESMHTELQDTTINTNFPTAVASSTVALGETHLVPSVSVSGVVSKSPVQTHLHTGSTGEIIITPGHSPGSSPGSDKSRGHSKEGTSSDVFRFDSTDRERYLCRAISEEEEVFSPGVSPSAYSIRSYDSPKVVLDSPRITISPLAITDSPPATPNCTPVSMEGQHGLLGRLNPGLTLLPATATMDQSRCLFGVPSSPISPLTPNTPVSPSPLFPPDQMFQQGFLAELYRRSALCENRCHSDSDLPDSPKSEATDLSMKATSSTGVKSVGRPRKPIPHPLTMPSKSGSLESDQSTPQDSPLDLSLKGTRDQHRFLSSASCESLCSSRFMSSLPIPNNSPGISVVRGDVSSPTARNSVALKYNLEVSPVVEEMPPGSDMAFVCPVCGQMFSLHDRLAKHMASRHKSKPTDPNKSYPCEVCHRSFARSDMLTRHVRLHTGVKPYTCKICGQVFSRSDHLSTHQRTHTGEKPYKCPQCPYSACRRDMITRHLRTHMRNSSSSSSDVVTSSSTPTTQSTSDSLHIDEHGSITSKPIKLEHSSSRPPSSSSSFAPDSPISPMMNISSLSVQSPVSPSFTKD